VVFLCSLSVAANRLAPNPQYPGIVDDYRRTFARLKGVAGDVMLAAHAEQFDLLAKRARLQPGASNPFIVPDELARFVRDAEAAFVTSLAEQQQRR
jgi:metallo-beta-lactamase class B